jgi:septum formation topological specificity factor MinE
MEKFKAGLLLIKEQSVSVIVKHIQIDEETVQASLKDSLVVSHTEEQAMQGIHVHKS